MRIGFFGDGPWAHLTFSKLTDNHNFEIVFVCTRHIKPDPHLKNLAERKGIPVFCHCDINSNDSVQLITSFKADVFVSMSFDQIFRSAMLSSAPSGIINCHAGLLPFYRGRNVLNWVLINDEETFGITVHFVDEVDTGDIIEQACLKITDEDNYGSLLERAYPICAELVELALIKLSKNEIKRIPQNSIHPVGFYCCKRVDGDERINWSLSARQIFNHVRAVCSPGPSAITSLRGNDLIIHRAMLIPDAPSYVGIYGSIVGVSTDGFVVKTNDSSILIRDWECDVNPRIGDRLK